jgi:hypothetical protein
MGDSGRGKIGKGTTDHARIDKGIFELGVAGQELVFEERGVFDVGVHGNVECQLGRHMCQVDCFYHCVSTS